MTSFIETLKGVNKMPFPVTIPYFVSYGIPKEKFEKGKMRSGDAWMVLRNEHPHYRIAATREEWLEDLKLGAERDGQDSALPARVEALARLIEREGFTTFYSVGSGGGVFEYYLKKRLPRLRVIVSECTEEGADRLKRVLPEADGAELFDALSRKDWDRVAALPKTLVFIYRNEREFSDEQWELMWKHMYESGVKSVFWGLMWTLTIRALVQLYLRNAQKRLRGEKLVLTGYLRSRYRLEQFFKNRYTLREDIDFPTCSGLYLTRNQ